MQLPLTCFLVDNDSEDQEIFSLALREVDPAIHCTFADSGSSAIRKFMEDPSFLPTFIFIDMNMPLMNGIECLQEIKRLDHLKNIPIFIYSTASVEKAIAEAKNLGADFIVKPPSFMALTGILKKLLTN